MSENGVICPTSSTPERMAPALDRPSDIIRPEIGLRYSLATVLPSPVARYVIDRDSGNSGTALSTSLARLNPKTAGPFLGLITRLSNASR